MRCECLKCCCFFTHEAILILSHTHIHTYTHVHTHTHVTRTHTYTTHVHTQYTTRTQHTQNTHTHNTHTHTYNTPHTHTTHAHTHTLCISLKIVPSMVGIVTKSSLLTCHFNSFICYCPQAIGDGAQGWGNVILFIVLSTKIRRRITQTITDASWKLSTTSYHHHDDSTDYGTINPITDDSPLGSLTTNTPVTLYNSISPETVK